jgi:hypothetical protein
LRERSSVEEDESGSAHALGDNAIMSHVHAKKIFSFNSGYTISAAELNKPHFMPFN